MHASSSEEQHNAESLILSLLNEREGLTLEPCSVPISTGYELQIDGFDGVTCCEIYARQDELKSSQADKVACDILKLLFLERGLNKPLQKILCFASPLASKRFLGNSWLAQSTREFEVEVITVELPAESVEELKTAQKRQFR